MGAYLSIGTYTKSMGPYLCILSMWSYTCRGVFWECSLPGSAAGPAGSAPQDVKRGGPQTASLLIRSLFSVSHSISRMASMAFVRLSIASAVLV